MSQTMEFVHPLLGETVTAIGGHYAFTKEARLALDEREILYFVGYGATDTSCCGMSGCIYAMVPGYLRDYHMGTVPETGRAISLVEPVEEAARKAVATTLKAREGVTQVHFLTPQGDKQVLF